MTFKAYNIGEAIDVLNTDGGDDDGIGVDAQWQVGPADALELAAWWLDTIGVEPVEEQLLQDWLAGKLGKLLGVAEIRAEAVAYDAALAVARRLGIDTGIDGVDLVDAAIEHTDGDPGRLFREIAVQLRG